MAQSLCIPLIFVIITQRLVKKTKLIINMYVVYAVQNIQRNRLTFVFK